MKPDSPTTPGAPTPPRPRGKVFDVMAPGKTRAHPASRPVVIGHKAAAQQAQMTVSGIGESDGRDKLLAVHKKSEVAPTEPVAAESEPTTSTPAGSADTTPVEPVVAAATAPDPLLDEPTTPPTPTPTDSPAPTPEPEDKQDDALDAVAMEPDEPAPSTTEQMPTPTPVHDDPVPEDVAPPSIEHQVVVSHHSTEPRSTGKLIGLILLALFFVIVVVDILMDAGVITTSLPHTHFF